MPVSSLVPLSFVEPFDTINLKDSISFVSSERYTDQIKAKINETNSSKQYSFGLEGFFKT